MRNRDKGGIIFENIQNILCWQNFENIELCRPPLRSCRTKQKLWSLSRPPVSTVPQVSPKQTFYSNSSWSRYPNESKIKFGTHWSDQINLALPDPQTDSHTEYWIQKTEFVEMSRSWEPIQMQRAIVKLQLDVNSTSTELNSEMSERSSPIFINKSNVDTFYLT